VALTQSLSCRLLQSAPPPNDPQWTNQLHKLPKVTYDIIYDFLVDRKVLLRKASHLENIVDKNADVSEGNDEMNDFKKYKPI